MATGDQDDFVKRLKSVLPVQWFNDSNQILDAVLNGLASALSWVYQLYTYAVLQTRILTATDSWLDIIANDFFGERIKRQAGQTNDEFLNVIRINLFRERGTRQAIIKVLEDLTGNTPKIIEPARPQDCGGYNMPNIGYGVAGAYGSLLMPYQAFVIAYRPTGEGVPYVGGYTSTVSGYSTPSRGKYASYSELTGVTDTQIYAAVASVKMEGTTVWVRIE
ncbi:hypothetical protein ACHHY8_02645 [Enterobacter cloacae complex sp. 2024EL-00215]|uniref:hypothetical protein n=1 Tax=unclassified Enterobacter cloacae complex TaxID=2757714 RepID=UPI003750A806